LFDRPAFRTCLAHGIVLGDDGLKMSKSKGNYPEVTEVFDRDGSDAMRWFLMASPILRGGNLMVTEQGIREAVRQALLPLWNSWYFLTLYANAAGVDGQWRTDSPELLDRYVLAKLHDLVVDVAARMDRYDIAGACDSVRGFCDVLTNWYVRRSRDRFWAGQPGAIETLHTVLEVTCRVAAPLLPLTTEVIWRGLTGQRSVHLTDWPDPATLPADPDLVTAMDRVRQVVSAALSVRKSRGIRVRQPLPTLTVAAPDVAALTPFTDLIRDEVNVRSVTLTEDVGAYGRFELTVNARACGPRLGGDTQKVIRAVKAGEWERGPDGVLTAGGIPLLEGEYTERLVAADASESAALPAGSGLVVLDTAITAELAAEGIAKDLVRIVQQARKQAGLNVTDRIVLTVDAPAAVLAAAREHEQFVAGEVLARRVDYGLVEDGFAGIVGDGVAVRVAVAVVSA
ncbi:MAG: class I tRNA ligase family protein, partial [Pseudonocardiaceae bacterium]